MALYNKKMIFLGFWFFLFFTFLSGCYYLPQPNYRPEPTLRISKKIHMKKNTPEGDFYYDVNIEGGIYYLPSDEEVKRAAKGAAILLNENTVPLPKEKISRPNRRHKRKDLSRKDEYQPVITVQANNLSHFEIFKVVINSKAGEQEIVSLPRGKISRPINLVLGERAQARIWYVKPKLLRTRTICETQSFLVNDYIMFNNLNIVNKTYRGKSRGYYVVRHIKPIIDNG